LKIKLFFTVRKDSKNKKFFIFGGQKYHKNKEFFIFRGQENLSKIIRRLFLAAENKEFPANRQF
jgi:hypothetical protein